MVAIPFVGILFFKRHDDFSLRLTFFDAGQGTAIAIETKNHQVIYDTGRTFSRKFNVGEHIIGPSLHGLNKANIDTLNVSHGDNDHAGGVSGLLKNITTKRIVAGQPQSMTYHTELPASQCVAGQYWSLDDVEFRVLWPTEGFLASSSRTEKSNNFSCVLSIRYKNNTIFLAGDIESSVESRMLQELSFFKPVDILLVPHHGSKTSSSKQWIAKLSPTWAIVTAGYRNHYNHPHPNIVRRYTEQGSHLLNTAKEGAIRFTLIDNQWHLERWRSYYRRYWYD